jgi:hypothetical protein
VRDQPSEVRPPSAEVVVDVDDGDTGTTGADREASDARGHGACLREHSLGFLVVEVVDRIDDEQRDRTIVGRIAVEIPRRLSRAPRSSCTRALEASAPERRRGRADGHVVQRARAGRLIGAKAQKVVHRGESVRP